MPVLVLQRTYVHSRHPFEVCSVCTPQLYRLSWHLFHLAANSHCQYFHVRSYDQYHPCGFNFRSVLEACSETALAFNTVRTCMPAKFLVLRHVQPACTQLKWYPVCIRYVIFSAWPFVDLHDIGVFVASIVLFVPSAITATCWKYIGILKILCTYTVLSAYRSIISVSNVFPLSSLKTPRVTI